MAVLAEELISYTKTTVGGVKVAGSASAPLGTVTAVQLKRLIHCATAPDVWVVVDASMLAEEMRRRLLDSLAALEVYRLRAIVQNSHDALHALLVREARVTSADVL